MRQVVLDTETTGISTEHGHRIIEIGCIEIIDRKLTGNNFHCYIHPEREIDEGAQRVHGISLDFLADKPKFAEIAHKLYNFLDQAELIIHNAPFDLGFLDAEYNYLVKAKEEDYLADKIFRKNFKVIDTLQLARKMYPGQRNSLDALCKRLEVDNSNRELHGALLDSELLAEVYLKLTYGQTKIKFGGKDENNIDSETRSGEDLNKQEKPFTYKKISIDSCELVVNKADEQELKAHSDFMEKLGQDSW